MLWSRTIIVAALALSSPILTMVSASAAGTRPSGSCGPDFYVNVGRRMRKPPKTFRLAARKHLSQMPRRNLKPL